MAEEHAIWIGDIFSDLAAEDVRGLDAAAYREAQQGRWHVVPYGTGARNTIDFFPAKSPAGSEGPIVVFIHGGYWQALDGSSFSHLAAGLNAHGISVAVPSYDLCPSVTIADIISQMRTASRELARLRRPLVMSGHSAGGHLAACMLATDWRALDASLPEGLVTAAYAISGLFDLRPLVKTALNNAAGVATRFAAIPGANHFTAIAPLADPQSPMTLRLKELAR